MKPGTIFISHRAEYGNLVRELKKAIETTSRGKIKAKISEDLPGAEKWRSAIKIHLEDAESLFSFTAQPTKIGPGVSMRRDTSPASMPPKNNAPHLLHRPARCFTSGPLNDLQMVTNKERLITDLIEIYDRNNVDYDPVKLRESINQAAKGLFRKRGIRQLPPCLFHRQ